MTISVSFFPPGSILKPDYNNSKKRKKEKSNLILIFKTNLKHFVSLLQIFSNIFFILKKKLNAKNNGTVPPSVWSSCHYFPKKQLPDFLDLVYNVSLTGKLQ